MPTATKEIGRLSHTLIWRGALMFAFGAAAAIWPEPVLIGAMIAVGVVATILGLYEISIAVSVRGRVADWAMILTHGIASLVYPAATIFALLFFGAVFAALFGAWQVAAGLLIRRLLQKNDPTHHTPPVHAHA